MNTIGKTAWNFAGTRSRRTMLKDLAFSALAMSLLPATSLTAHAAAKPKVLISYFSHTGNTRAVARVIHAAVGGDLLEITVQQTYPAEHSITESRAQQEWEENVRPALAMEFPADMDAYDLIFVGYPCWFRTTPMAVLTFLEQFKFAGKTIAPFTTHGGNGLANGPRDMAKSCPQATVIEGLAIGERRVANAEGTVNAWLQKNAMLTQLMNK